MKLSNRLRVCFSIWILFTCNDWTFCQDLPENFVVLDVNTTTLGDAVGFDFLHDGRIVQIYKNGSVRIIADGKINQSAIFVVPELTTERESGLLGVAVDPDFPDQPYIYLFHTHISGTNWISRFTVTGDLNDPSSIDLTIDGDSQVVLKDDIISDNPQHNAGTLRFGNDHTLYASLGDDVQSFLVQDLTTLNGTIIRINRDGSIPSDNPTFPNEPANRKPEIFAIGLRNPFRFQIDPVSDQLFIGDVGLLSFEEIDLSTGGENFGWPRYEGNLELDPSANVIEPEVTFPIWTYAQEPEEETFSVIALAVYRQVDFGADFSFPDEFDGALFYCDFGHDWIRYLKRDEEDQWVSEDFATGFPSLTDGRVGPDGGLYVLTFGGALKKIVYAVSNNISGLISFIAELKENRVLLRWEFFGVDRSASFTVQRSFDGQEFEDIGFVQTSLGEFAELDYRFTDFEIHNGTFYYRLKRVNSEGITELSEAIHVEVSIPTDFILNQNFPNPFNPSTTISYFVPRNARVTLRIYNVHGQLVRTLFDGQESFGNKTIEWDAKNDRGQRVTAGVYFAQLQAENFSQTRKLVYLR